MLSSTYGGVRYAVALVLSLRPSRTAEEEIPIFSVRATRVWMFLKETSLSAVQLHFIPTVSCTSMKLTYPITIATKRGWHRCGPLFLSDHPAMAI